MILFFFQKCDITIRFALLSQHSSDVYWMFTFLFNWCFLKRPQNFKKKKSYNFLAPSPPCHFWFFWTLWPFHITSTFLNSKWVHFVKCFVTFLENMDRTISLDILQTSIERRVVGKYLATSTVFCRKFKCSFKKILAPVCYGRKTSYESYIAPGI